MACNRSRSCNTSGERSRTNTGNPSSRQTSLVKCLSRVIRDYRRPHAIDLRCHLLQQQLVPVFSCRHLFIHICGDQFEHSLESCIEAMQVERNAVKIQIVVRSFGLTPGFLCSFHDTVQILTLTPDSICQLQQVIAHTGTPSRSMTRRSAGRQSCGSTRSTLNSSLKPVTAATARKKASGGMPHAARSISDQRVNHSSCASEPKTTTRLAPNRSRSKSAAARATSQALSRRSGSSFSRTLLPGR